ncbi:YggS family pyridoxal phosphate-dependent enzyme [Flavobacterium sp. xlx-214]|uniref:YggS family pyridoxal phosphate-dependent enzyme n=1 Tax=unclassified Flavobacterium TaxID=196869 RepID=UPI0013D26F20|nr:MULTISPECIES: YggS family pyridoxal phosphate-dependent enzyme [unclassified Flavobacterium]MBA5791858.1 YggS family pyridoxal phosphate-dependent enzyme [Flavobacterium sp. xlx-221]QMI83095.1 YggS family pyridoxal phosphate-dependent enzyme [Flavobacterium sp. xlx-214]
MSITTQLQKINNELPSNVHLVAVSKTKPVADLMEAYNAGQRIFGENKIQEMTDKWQQMPKDIQWHMIGHVQTNKVKYMAPYVSLIHGVDSLKLLIEINKQAKKWRRTIACLLQVYIATEETKFGLAQDELLQVIHSEEFKALENIKVIGLMGMASFTDDATIIEKEFQSLKDIFDYIQPYQLPNCHFQQLSMGMSGDYKIAIKCGSTIVRIGSSLFGER